MRVIFKTIDMEYTRLPDYDVVDFHPLTSSDQHLLFDDPQVAVWLIEHGVDWSSCMGATVRRRDDIPYTISSSDRAMILSVAPPQLYGATITEVWIDFEDVSLATLFRLRWG